MFGVLPVGFVADLAGAVERPVRVDAAAIARRDQPARGRQPLHVGQQRLGRARHHRQVLADHRLVRPSAHRRMRQQRLRLGGEEEDAGTVVVIKRLDAQNVARAEQPAARRVPDRQREIAEQPRCALLRPAAVSAQGEGRVERRRGREPLGREGLLQFLPVVDPSVEDDAHAGVRDRVRLSLVDRLRRGGQQGVAERDRPVQPHGRAIGSAMPNRTQHPRGQHGIRRPVVEIEEADDAAQPCVPPDATSRTTPLSTSWFTKSTASSSACARPTCVLFADGVNRASDAR